MLTDAQVQKINDERRRKGQAAITKQQAESASRNAGHSGNEAFEFCLGLSGVPWPSAMGIAGFAIHELSSPAPTDAGADTSLSAPDTSSGSSDSSSSDSSGGCGDSD